MTYSTPYLRGKTYYFKYRVNKRSYQKSTGQSRLRDAQRYIHVFIDRVEAGTTNANLGSQLETFSEVDTNPKFREAKVLDGHYGHTHAKHVAITSKHCIDLLQRTVYYTKPLSLFNKLDVKQIASLIVGAHGQCEKSVKMFKHIKMVFNYAQKQGIIPYSVAQGVADIKCQVVRKNNVISRSELVRVFTDRSLFPNKASFYLFNMIAFTGMRRGEALALTKQQIDLEKKTITIDRALKDTGEIGLPKWDKSRVIPICDHLAENLKVFIEGLYTDRLFTVNRKAISTKTYSEWFKKVSREQELGITAHGLRHTIHTQLRAMGCPDSLLSTYMAWSKQNQSAIQERYTDYMVEDLRVVSESIGRLIDG